MRSHTGDRPYKCLYCGDQFARSDLLSRHCNKCHANEKPILNVGARRRGSASASRATTSKQACDQCVQSSLPCDGSNPCAKCVQRKCRCTYVKFHRQTAPVGPGHNPRPANLGAVAGSSPGLPGGLPAHPSSSRMLMYPPHTDEFLVGSHPPVVPHMTENMYSSSLGFPPLYSQPADPATSLPLSDSPDLAAAAKYRPQPDPYRRSSMPLLVQPSTAPGAGLIPGLYADPRQSPNWMAWGQDNDSSFSSSSNNHPEGIHDKNLQVELSQHFMGSQGVLLPTSGDPPYPHPNAYIDQRNRRGSSDYASEGSSATSHSVPSSATSSSVHLPVEGMTMHQQYPSDQQPFVVSDRAYSNRGQDGGFPAFGLLSLDDHNVLASISNGNSSFFVHNAINTLGTDDPNQTPMPPKPLESPNGQGCAVQMPSKETEIHPGQQNHDGNVTSSMRTTLAPQEDLKSYEAAVMARKAPTTLSLGPRARRNKAGTQVHSQSTSPQVPNQQMDPNVINLNYSPPGSSRSLSATVPALPPLATWSGKLPPLQLAYAQEYMSTSSPPSRESSLSVDDSAGSGGSDREGGILRPSFKRLPSQPLGPVNTKRAQLSHEVGSPRSGSSGIPVPVYGSSSGGANNGADIDGGNVGARASMSAPDLPALVVPSLGGVFVDPRQRAERPIVGLGDRRRRMSASLALRSQRRV
ncbi:hypothetical protein APHAL10511_000780 [Amanita phalloides]|nr:hypothetical protein APHAL10511_000780 [Amanita phalloides]